MKNFYRSSFVAMILMMLSNFSLNAQCAITIDPLGPVYCDDNGTPSDPTDDLFLFDVWIFGDTVVGNSWIASDGSTGLFDTLATFGPYPIANGDVSITIMDSDAPDCTTSITIAAPTNCPDPACEIIANVSSPVCDDNGTPGNPGDDTFTFDVVLDGANASSIWIGNDGSSGSYGVTTAFGPYSIANGSVTIIFTDALNASCFTIVTVDAPNACSAGCNLNATVMNLICDDAGTPQTPHDDIFSPQLLVESSGTNGDTWEAMDFQGNTFTGTYDVLTTIPESYLISDGPFLYWVQDAGDPSCFDSLFIFPPPTCSDDYIDLELFKSVSPSVAEAGETVTFYLEVWNWGPLEATGIEVTDYLPTGYESISNISNGGVLNGAQIVWSDMTILPGDSILFLSFDAVVAEDGDYLNTAEVTAADQFDPDSTPGNGVDTDADGECLNDPDDEDDSACIAIVNCTNSDLSADAGPDISLGCNPGTIVTVGGMASGGTEPYSYHWEDSMGNVVSIEEFFATTTPGTYTLVVMDASGCIATDAMDITAEDQIVAEAGPIQTISCVVSSVTLDGSESSTGPEFEHLWTGPNGFTTNNLVVVVSEPGWYLLTVTNTNDTTCVASDWTYVLEEIVTPQLNYYLLECGEAVIYDMVGDSIFGEGRIWTLPDGSTSDEYNITTTETGMYYLEITSQESGCYGIDSIYVDLDPESCSTLSGKVYWDTVENCTEDADEEGLDGWIVQITDGVNTYHKVTDANGNYSISLPLATYTVSVIVPDLFVWYPCEDMYIVDVDAPGSTYSLDMPVQKAAECPVMTVDISTFWLRSCRNNIYWVDYCNEGTGTAEDAYVTVQIDPSLTYTTSSIPLVSQNGGLLTFDLGDVEPNECGYFRLELFIDCDAELGQIHCAEAHVYPDTLCTPPPASWSGASLQVGADCDGDEVHFTIENIGDGDMSEPANFIVIEDGVMMAVAPGEVQLNSMDDYSFSMPANGATYRLEADQVANHPGASMPSVSVEGCGLNENGTFSTGFVNLFPMDDEEQFIDIECRENNGPYDPNDKTGFPRGFGEEHYIHTNTDLEYLIRFQNVGTDTAFNVVIRDTISSHLDITSIRPGVSSHSYSWDIDKGNAVVFTFENIMLPDSNVNVDASQGFIKFNIAQQRDLPLETVIENSAAIYFDFNDPVITNTTFHTIGDDFLEVVNFVAGPDIAPDALEVYPNPVKNVATFQLKDWEGAQVDIQLFDVHGRLLLNDQFSGNAYELNRQQLPSGMYFFRLESKGTLIGSGKLMME